MHSMRHTVRTGTNTPTLFELDDFWPLGASSPGVLRCIVILGLGNETVWHAVILERCICLQVSTKLMYSITLHNTGAFTG